MPAVREILIGRRTGDHLLLAVRGRLFPDGTNGPDGTDDADADWLWATATVECAGFGCRLDGNLLAGELSDFRAALEGMQESTATEAVLDTEDGWLVIELAADAEGAITVRIRVRHGGPLPAELRCGLSDLQPASLTATIESLAEVERAYPTVD